MNYETLLVTVNLLANHLQIQPIAQEFQFLKQKTVCCRRTVKVDKLVEDVYYIDQDWIEAIADDSDYWEASLRFWNQVKKKPLDSLTPKQAEWLAKIEDKYVAQS